MDMPLAFVYVMNKFYFVPFFICSLSAVFVIVCRVFSILELELFLSSGFNFTVFILFGCIPEFYF
jgi:hypothetical protein